MTRSLFLILLAGSLAGPAAADDDDHGRAQAAMQAGQIRPLTELLAGIERRYAGQVIEADLDHDKGRWVYEVKLLPPTGQAFEVSVDAASGAVIAARGPSQERR